MAIDCAFPYENAMAASLTNPLCPEAPSPSGKVITAHRKQTQNPILIPGGLHFPSLPSSILEKEIILLAEQPVSIAAFS